MSTELRRSLFAAAFAGAALVACGGGGNGTGASSGSPSPGPTPPPPPAPPPASAGSYFLTGHANTGFSSAQIAFFDGAQPVNPYPLVVVDPAAGTPAATQFEAEATTLDIANASEWFPSAGTATAWGVRYRLYARHDVASGKDNLYKIDLRKSGAMPAAMQLSTVVVAGSGSQPPLCWFDRAFFDNFRAADQSWIVFHAKGPDADCGTTDDQFVAVKADYAATTAPVLLKQVQPVEAVYDSTGQITSFLAINHPTVNSSGQPLTAVPLQQLGTDLSTVKATFGRKLSGIGVTGGSGDFSSLGVSSAGTWLYRDSSDIWAVDLASGVSTLVFTAGNAGDEVQGRAVFDGASPTIAYVAVNSSVGGSYVVRIDTSTKQATAQAPDGAAVNGIAIAGITSASAVYVFLDGSAIKSVSKANLANAAATLYSAAANQSVQPPPGSPSGTPPAVYLVSDRIYFTVGDSSNGASFAYSGSGNAGSATAIGAGAGAVLGTIATGTFSTAGPVVNAGALVVSGGVNSPNLTFSGAALASYDASGALAVAIGTLPAPAQPMPTVAISTAPLQVGMPGMIEMTGGNPNTLGQPVDDVGLIGPGAATSFLRVTPYMQ